MNSQLPIQQIIQNTGGFDRQLSPNEIEAIELKCRQLRSEAIFTFFASFFQSVGESFRALGTIGMKKSEASKNIHNGVFVR